MKTRYFVVQVEYEKNMPLYLCQTISGEPAETDAFPSARFYANEDDAVKDMERYASTLRGNYVMCELGVKQVCLRDNFARVTI